MEVFSNAIDDLPAIAKRIIEFAGSEKIWLFLGEMGAGKTTLIQSICKSMGVRDSATSPTFSIVNEYRDSNDESIYHFDFYRIKDETEAMDIGVEEYFDSGKLCLMEWPEKIPSLIPDRHLSISISVETQKSRKITLQHNG